MAGLIWTVWFGLGLAWLCLGVIDIEGVWMCGIALRVYEHGLYIGREPRPKPRRVGK